MIGLAPAVTTTARCATPRRAQRDAELRDRIERIHLEFPGYGYRLRSKPSFGSARAWRQRQAYSPSQLGIQALPRWFVASSGMHRLGSPAPVYPGTCYAISVVTGLNQAWVAGHHLHIRILTGLPSLAGHPGSLPRKAVAGHHGASTPRFFLPPWKGSLAGRPGTCAAVFGITYRGVLYDRPTTWRR